MPAVFTPPTRARGQRGYVPSNEDIKAVLDLLVQVDGDENVIPLNQWVMLDETAPTYNAMQTFVGGYKRQLDPKLKALGLGEEHFIQSAFVPCDAQTGEHRADVNNKYRGDDVVWRAGIALGTVERP